jgi:hypothetical protein
MVFNGLEETEGALRQYEAVGLFHTHYAHKITRPVSQASHACSAILTSQHYSDEM